jgi:hypothetical protein
MSKSIRLLILAALLCSASISLHAQSQTGRAYFEQRAGEEFVCATMARDPVVRSQCLVRMWVQQMYLAILWPFSTAAIPSSVPEPGSIRRRVVRP